MLKSIAVFCCVVFCLQVTGWSTTLDPQNLPSAELRSGHFNTDRSIDDQLKIAVRLARRGHVKRGFELAREMKEMVGDDLQFSFKYVDTLVQLAEECGAECDKNILNEAIRTANFVYRLECCNGTDDPEPAYQFMATLSKLGEAVRKINPTICSQLFLVEGTIAENLLSNDQVSEESYTRLAESFLDAAIGKAIGGEDSAAIQLVRRAFKMGYNQYSFVENDDALSRLPEIDAVTLEAKLNVARSASSNGDGSSTTTYRQTVRKPVARTPVQLWAHNQIQNFRAFDFTFNTLDTKGGRIRKEDFSGKVVLVDIWATWCPPCRKSIPDMVQLQKRYGGDRFQVVGLSVDAMDNPASAQHGVAEFLKQMNAKYPCGLGGREIPAQIKGDQTLPMVIFLGTDGKVRFALNGKHSYEQLEALTTELLRK